MFTDISSLSYFFNTEIKDKVIYNFFFTFYVKQHFLLEPFKIIKAASVVYIFIRNFISIFCFLEIEKKLNNFYYTNTTKTFFGRYFFMGLGFKMFMHLKKLFVWVGLTHYTILTVPSTLYIFSRKKRIYLIGRNENHFKWFLTIIRYIKKRDIYKGKGLLEVKTYKNFTIMKTGKKKQY